MAIQIHSSGDGTAYVNDYNPEPNQWVTLFAYPNSGETLNDITATDAQGHSIAMSVSQEQSFRYNSSWGTMHIYVTFSGSGPTPPTPTFPYWLLFKIRDGNKNVR